MKFKLNVTWIMTGEVEVEANSMEEAIDNFSPDDHDLPKNGEYMSDSFELL